VVEQCGRSFGKNYFLGKGFAKTSAHLFLNSDVANGKGGVWGGIFHLLLFLFWQNSGGLKKLRKIVIHVSIVVRVSFNAHTYTIILWKANKIKKLGIK